MELGYKPREYAIIVLMMKETFYLQVPPGFEELAKIEFELKYPSLAPNQPLPEAMVERGGLSIEMPLTSGLALNYWLKIPNRILLRFAHFKCRDIPKLYNKVSKLDWTSFYAGQNYKFHISSQQSRLFDDRKIEKALKDGLDHAIKKQEPKAKAKRRVETTNHWHLFCRFDEDWCTLSIDTSGERLGLRGYKARVGMAPLRENLAAGLFLFTALSEAEGPHHPHQEKALTLMDPFCGSGTILLESALFYEPNLFRNYAFEFFPLWEQKNSPLKDFKRPSSLNLDHPYFLVASDKNPDRTDDTSRNLKEAGFLEEDHIIRVGDILKKEFNQSMAKSIFGSQSNVHAWCLTNPPYGERVKQPLSGTKLLETLDEWGPWERVGVLLPLDQKLPQEIANLVKVKELPFENGGMKVVFTLYKSKEL